jgi:hypothetical protein
MSHEHDEAAKPSPHVVQFAYVESGEPIEPIFTLNADGTLSINPRYTISESAKAFWDEVKRLAGQEPKIQ